MEREKTQEIVFCQPYLFLKDLNFFYANEHEPKHIHVMKGGDFTKINLISLKVIDNYMKPKDIKRALSIVKQHQTDFIRKWDEYFN